MYWWEDKRLTIKDELVKQVALHEGYEQNPYIDPLVRKAPEQHGIPPDDFKIIEKHFDKLKVTIGIGLTNITKDEAMKVTEMRLQSLRKQIVDNYPHIKNNTVLDVLTEMSFQIGLRGMFAFKKMHQAIKDKDYYKASNEMKNSRYYAQTKRGLTASLQLI